MTRLIKNYNNWDVEFDIPFMQLTTLDKNVDAKITEPQTPKGA